MALSLFFFFKQKTAYEMRISDWSSDVCSSDLEGKTHAEIMQDADRDSPRQAAGGMAFRGNPAGQPEPHQAGDQHEDPDTQQPEPESCAGFHDVFLVVTGAPGVGDTGRTVDRKSKRLNSCH